MFNLYSLVSASIGAVVVLSPISQDGYLIQGDRSFSCSSIASADLVTIAFRAETVSGFDLNYIYGEFVVDMSGCAPDGGYGLSTATGAAGLERVVMTRRDYADHFGGVVSHNITSSEISFAGGFTFPSDGYSEDWRFVVNRVTGNASLLWNRRETSFQCALPGRTA